MNFDYDRVPGEDHFEHNEDDIDHMRFPVALEKALDLKNERIKEGWADDDEVDSTYLPYNNPNFLRFLFTPECFF